VTHPVEQLAPYVDGALDPAERAGVETHLASCSACREEVRLATRGRDMLRTVPGPTRTPADLGAPALAEMARGAGISDGTSSRWNRVVPWVAAAAVIGLLAVALPRIGDGNSSSTENANEAAAQPQVPRDLRVEVVHVNYDVDSLQAAAQDFIATHPATGAEDTSGGVTQGSGTPGPSSPARILGTGETKGALACLRSAFPGFPGEPVRIVLASFKGAPAYLGYVLEGPGADQPPDTVTIWVVAVKDCSILSFTTAAL